jgi:DNA-binding NarL/FixJ family response regulator
MIRVLIVDDQAVVRAGFRTMLEVEHDFEVVGEAGDGSGVADLVERRDADVVLMDVRMPGVDGIEATRRIVAEQDARVLIITTYDFDEVVFEALRAGASGFLLKSAQPQELSAAIRTVMAGDGVVAPAVARRVIARFAEVAPPTAARAVQALTPREHDVLLLVARGLSNAEIAERLVIETATVKRHVGSLLTKLGLKSRAQLIVYAFQHGHITVGDL